MTGKELYQIAKKHIGENGRKARAYCGMGGGAWCCAYVCYIFGQGKVASLFYGGKKVVYCPTAIKWCSANLAQIPLYLAMPMDIIFFDWNANNVPDHIGFVKARKNSSEIFTHEGNTNGGIVAEKTRPAKYVLGIFRPHFTPKGLKKEKLKVDGAFDYQSVYMFQVALGLKPDGILGKGTVKAWQKLIGVPQDGAWGRKTTLASQRFLKVKQDGAWGKDSTIALQKWTNAKVFPSSSVKKSTTTKPTASKTTAKTSTTTTKTSTPAKKTSTPTRKKMSKIGHARKDYDHKAGDSSGKEVCVTKFTYNSSDKSVYDWTYVFRPKDIAKAEKAASMCEKGCANNNIGYCSSGETKYGKDRAMSKLAKAAKYDLSKIKVKCGCSCGDLVCLCNHYAGLSTCYIGSGKQLAASLKKNKNFECIPYKKGMQLYRGDTLITAHQSGKNNHVVMCL